ncbi:MAG: hypoxanthine phosphoribosyltransferase [Thermodesulfobacteriota bacterium]
MPKLLPVLTENDIRTKVSIVAQQISSDYQDKELVLVGVLKGAFVFLADLIRQLTIPVTIDFIWVSSYGCADTTSGTVTRVSDITTDISGKQVLIVEDILDTGLTVKELIGCLAAHNPASIGVCAFVDKSVRRQNDCRADYACHRVEEGFLVGYGLDFAEKYRHLPALYELNNTISEEVK